MERGTRDWKDLRVPKNELGRVMFLEIGKAMDLVVAAAAAAIEEMRVVEVAEQAIFLGGREKQVSVPSLGVMNSSGWCG